jgi:hypothetical protein
MKPATTSVDTTAFSVQKLPIEYQLFDPKVSRYDSALTDYIQWAIFESAILA